ncbi:hypothetical protein [Alteromonas sp. ASW11-130]|uniref:hypothetical protein n=1 Tax=Alteromonas sp. ASW11-130 TaxID=3015775 RepID=UPI002241C9E2|nr:hypothetical protein [Alteromonas sp. ASW11-130]MCW8091997.1 hypothetical protein [Alteromonas sp. ASW11-130]
MLNAMNQHLYRALVALKLPEEQAAEVAATNYMNHKEHDDSFIATNERLTKLESDVKHILKLQYVVIGLVLTIIGLMLTGFGTVLTLLVGYGG